MAVEPRAVDVGSADQIWGPRLPGTFDFTLTFEQSMFSVLPACMLLGATPIQISHLVRRRPCARPGLLLWLKLAFAVALVGCHAASVYYWIQPPLYTQMATAAAVFSILSDLCIGALLYVEHIFAIAPSAIVSAYLSIALLFDIAKARSYLLRGGLGALGPLGVAIAIIDFTLLMLQEVSKRSLLLDGLSSRAGAEVLSGFWSRRLFLWINSTLLLGFRSILQVKDLPGLGPEFDSEALHTKFIKSWSKGTNPTSAFRARIAANVLVADKKSKYALAKACFYTLPWHFIFVLVPRLCHTAFTFAQPYLIRRVIQGVADDDLSADATSGLIGATALIYSGMGISKACYQHLNFRFATYMRGILITEMCHKTLTLRDDQLRDSAILTLMTADIAGVERICTDFHNAIASVVELGLGLFVLWGVVGGASFLVLIPAGLATILLSVVTKRMGKARANWNQKTQERVAATSQALKQMKNLKATGLSKFISEYLQELREAEIKVSLKERHLLISIYATREFANAVTPVVVLAGAIFWTKPLSELSIANIFTALSTISITMVPLGTSLVALPFLAAGLASLERIQKFFARETFFQEPLTLTSEDLASERPLPAFQLELDHASIHQANYDTPLFDNVNLDFERGKIGMVVGKVGCGKTSMLKALIGEVQLTSGSVNRSKEPVGYCDQTAWIEDGSILDNIVGRSEYDEEWLRIVLQCCALDEDVQQLEAGIFTAVGAGGCRLSGGQKSRVALARAIYPLPRAMVLDDVFAPLDDFTAQNILGRLIGEDGLLRKMGVTVILTTSLREHLELADFVIMFEENGSVKKLEVSPASNFHDASFNGVLRDAADKHEGRLQALGASAPKLEGLNQISNELDKTARQKGDTLLYGYYVKTFGLLAFSLWLVLAVIAAGSSRLPSVYIRIWLDKAPANDLYFIGFAGVAIVHVFLIFLAAAIYYLKLVPRSSEVWHWETLQTLMKAQLNFLTMKDNGEIMNIFSQDMGLLSHLLPMKFAEFIFEVTTLVADIAIIASGATYASLIVPFCIGLVYVIQKFYLRTSRQVRLLDIEAKAPLYAKLGETKSSMPHIRAFGWETYFVRQCLALINYSQTPYYVMFCIQRWLTIVLDLSVAAIAVILIYCAVKFRSTTSQTAIGLALVNLTSFSQSLSKMITWWISMETAFGAVARTKSFIVTTPLEPTVEEEPDDLDLQSWPAHGTIQLSNVSSTYSTPTSVNQIGIDDVTTVFEDGQVVSVIGRTGSGKSSLIMTLLNTMDFTGTISIGGRNIRSVPVDLLREKITTIPQDGVELPGSVRTNVDPYRKKNSHTPESDARIVSTLTRLRVWDSIGPHGGLDADLGKLNLSKGQKQLVFLARAILRNETTRSKIVFMDEATSSVDEETDRDVRDIINGAFAGCTVINVTHRAYVAQASDAVLEFSRGQIGTELRRRPGYEYS
ncbi:hypothetical protein PWT90_09954 [Aphanocladium album]|nr:hypothetical protein PWT90_09954 [Aphanocladium album]